MILVWFVYGLAFFLLGVVILVYPKKDSRFDLARSIWMVGAFGIIHGLNEWLDMFIALGGPLPLGLMTSARMLTLAGSFFFLVQFGVTVLSRHARQRRLLRAIPPLLTIGWLAVVLASEPSQRLLMGDIWGRYLLCVPGTLLTAWGLSSQVADFKAMKLRSVTGSLAVAAVTFLVYGVLAGLVVKKASFFPASVLNYDTFTALTGLPVQIFRALCAVVAAWSLIRILDVFRWESQEALRISELRCATIASAMPVFLFMTDRDMVITFAQGKGLEILGLRPEQIRGRPVCAAFPRGEGFAEDCRRALAGQEFITTTMLNDTSFEIYYSALKDAEGVVTNVVGVALDVSARARAQRELDEYRRKMEKHAREAAVGVLSTTMARQVFEPLSVARLVLERTVVDRDGSDLPDVVRGGVSKGLSEIDKAHETLKRFMEITHPEAMVAEQPVGLYQIAKRTMSVFADVARQRKLTIAIRDMDIVPLMAVSPREIEQIFYHLIQRATDAADGNIEQRLVISCAVQEGHIDLSFCDTCGSIQPRPSPEASDSTLGDLEAVNDLGLGLAVVKRIVTGYGGQISLDAGPSGTTFRVRLPVRRIY